MLHGALDGDVHRAAVALAHVVLRGHPLVEPDHQHVQADAHGDHEEPARAHVHDAEREDEGERGMSRPNPTSSIRAFGNVTNSSDLDRQHEEQEPQRAKLDMPQATEAALRDDDDERGENDRAQVEHHGHNVVSGPWRAVDTVLDVYELRARAEGRVEQLVVDEGQMVAEEDAIAIVDSAGARVELTTDVPGVVRELYIERGQPVLRGEVIALIDES